MSKQLIKMTQHNSSQADIMLWSFAPLTQCAAVKTALFEIIEPAHIFPRPEKYMYSVHIDVYEILWVKKGLVHRSIILCKWKNVFKSITCCKQN